MYHLCLLYTSHADNDCDYDWEKDLLKLGYRAKLLHLDFTLFLSGKQFHDRRLDDRNQ